MLCYKSGICNISLLQNVAVWNIHWMFIQLSDHVGYDKIQMHLYNVIVDFVTSS
jgi:hypothetical protein